MQQQREVLTVSPDSALEVEKAERWGTGGGHSVPAQMSFMHPMTVTQAHIP